MEVLNSVPVKRGDVFFIDAGTLHAIGKGILIAEIQQNSNTTYRIYDFGRVGADGKPRELHIDKAIDVTKLEPPTRDIKPQGEPVRLDGYTKTLLAKCEYFNVEVLDVEKKAELACDDSSFHSLLCLEGELSLESEKGNIQIGKGDSIFLDAAFGAYTLLGKANVVLTTV
jgi:mannose-6-phosphate isomerase